MTSRQCGMAATIDILGDDLLQNIVTRLPAKSFAYAACVNRSLNAVCERLLSRPKLSSACNIGFDTCLQIVVEDVVDKVLSQPIRPHFAIVSVSGKFDFDEEDDVLSEAHFLITEALGSQVPVITNCPHGIIGRDLFYDQFKQIEFRRGYHPDALVLTVGYIPGLKVTVIPLSKHSAEPKTVMIDEFVTDIRDFSTSVSGSNSPAAVVLYGDCHVRRMTTVMEQMDYAMSPDTVIVGDDSSRFQSTNDSRNGITAAVALVFAVDRNKPPGIGQTQFHAVFSSVKSPVGPAYKATSVINRKKDGSTWVAARRVGSHAKIDGATILNQVYDQLGGRLRRRNLCIGVTKKRNCSTGQEDDGCMTSLEFHGLSGKNDGRYFFVFDEGIQAGDTFRFYHPDTTTAVSSAAIVSSHMGSLNRGSNITISSDKREVFGGLIFTCCGGLFFGQPNIVSSPFLDNFPGVALGGTFCNKPIGRGVLTPYVKESKEPKCFLHADGAVFLILSYTP